MSYSQASQSHYSFCADSDLGLNTDLLYSDDISELIGSQTPLISASQVSSPIAPLSLTRVGLPLQQYWVLYSSEPGSDIYSIYNKLFSHLDEAESKLKSKGVVWKKHMLQALQTAKRKPSTYYTATDYESYDWQGEIDYVDHYHGVLKREFHRYKETLHRDSDNTVLQDTTREAPDDDYGDLHAACATQNQPQDELSKPEDDEIARYLARGIESQKPRAFWKDHEHEFPILARIARDILSIPASGAGVERLFNCARDICHYRRGQLKPSTIRGLMLHQFATNFDVEQKEVEVIKEYLSVGEAALLDQARKPMPPS
ncbi:hypothetical protein N7451_012009 [Penicillium sp. IBT 35674x]|nr:hypothetical protein N7451_012009 [Penicillium sp. IBT 35674x]